LADQVSGAEKLIEQMVALIIGGQELAPQDLKRSAQMIETNVRPTDVLSQSILTSRGKSIRPKTLGQKLYVDAIDEFTVVFGIGPAGTGKTYLAMAKAVQALQRKEVRSRDHSEADCCWHYRSCPTCLHARTHSQRFVHHP
jgi:phosphate starvation-inducible PhoH-like protein